MPGGEIGRINNVMTGTDVRLAATHARFRLRNCRFRRCGIAGPPAHVDQRPSEIWPCCPYGKSVRVVTIEVTAAHDEAAFWMSVAVALLHTLRTSLRQEPPWRPKSSALSHQLQRCDVACCSSWSSCRWTGVVCCIWRSPPIRPPRGLPSNPARPFPITRRHGFSFTIETIVRRRPHNDRRHGHSPTTDYTPLTMAERVRGTRHWLHPTRVPRPCHRAHRGRLRRILAESSTYYQYSGRVLRMPSDIERISQIVIAPRSEIGRNFQTLKRL